MLGCALRPHILAIHQQQPWLQAPSPCACRKNALHFYVLWMRTPKRSPNLLNCSSSWWQDDGSKSEATGLDVSRSAEEVGTVKKHGSYLLYSQSKHHPYLTLIRHHPHSYPIQEPYSDESTTQSINPTHQRMQTSQLHIKLPI